MRLQSQDDWKSLNKSILMPDPTFPFYCARPTRAFSGRALREHRESQASLLSLLFPLLLLPGIVLEGVGRWFSTARIEGPQFYRGASASKEDRLATPGL